MVEEQQISKKIIKNQLLRARLEEHSLQQVITYKDENDIQGFTKYKKFFEDY